MRGGKLIVEGDVWGPLGMDMVAGDVLVEGDVYSFFTADSMKGGRIVVKGNARGIYNMLGGEVLVYGDIGKIEGTLGGNIYVGGNYNLVGMNKAKIWDIENIDELGPDELIALTDEAKYISKNMKAEGKIIRRRLSPDRLLIVTKRGEFVKEVSGVINIK